MSRSKSRPVHKSKQVKAAQQKETVTLPLPVRIIDSLLSLPRLVRIIICLIIAAAVTFAVSPLVDYIYLRYFYTQETRVLPSLVSSGLGMVSFTVGWWLLVGIVGDKPPARQLILWYVGMGVAVIIFVLILTIYGIATVNTPTFT